VVRRLLLWVLSQQGALLLSHALLVQRCYGEARLLWCCCCCRSWIPQAHGRQQQEETLQPLAASPHCFAAVQEPQQLLHVLPPPLQQLG
jgi:hypothetical protein